MIMVLFKHLLFNCIILYYNCMPFLQILAVMNSILGLGLELGAKTVSSHTGQFRIPKQPDRVRFSIGHVVQS